MQMSKGLTVVTWTIILGSMVCLTACQKPAESSATVGRDFKVEKLFTYEGCTVYRFLDDRRVYYTNCQGSTQSDCGKNCEQTVTTGKADHDSTSF